MSFDFQGIILPLMLGIFGGLLGPICLEKWKGNKEEGKKVLLLEVEMEKLQEDITAINSKLETMLNRFNSEIKDLEIKLSHTTGVLQTKMPDAGLE